MKNVKPWMQAAAWLLLSAMSAAAQEPPAELPFKLAQDYLIVAQGSVGGLEQLNFMIDTGAVPSMVDQRMASKLGLAAGERQIVAFGKKVRVKGVVLPELRLGPLRAQSLQAGVGDLSFLAGARIDAVVGLDVLTLSSFEIDYRARKIRFGPAAPLGSAADLKVVWPFLTVQMGVQGVPVRLLVDTGSRDLILFEQRVRGRLPGLIVTGEKVLYHASGESHLKQVRPSVTAPGQSQWRSHPAYLLDASTEAYPPDIDGVLGVLSLGVKRVRFDFEHNTLSYER
jgi:hypothetical protein